MSDNELDNLFKEAADGFKPPNDPAAWQDMARKLDQVAVATTASFWNWKTISSTVVVGVVLVGSVLYVALSDSAPGNESNSETVTSVDAALTPAIEKEAASDKTAKGNLEPSATTKSTATEYALTDKESKRLKSDERSAATAQEANVSKSDKSSTPVKQNLSTPQTQALQNSEKVMAMDNHNAAAVTTNSEARKKETKKDGGSTAAATLSGVVITGKAIEPATAGPTSTREGSSSGSRSTSRDSQKESGKESTAKNTGTATEKVTEPTSSGSVTSSESRANPSLSRGADSKNQSLPDDGNSTKKSEAGKVGAAATVVATEKSVESRSSATTGAQTEGTGSSRPVSKEKDENVQSTVAHEPLPKKDEVKESKQETLAKESDQGEPEAKEDQAAFNRFAIKLAVAPDYTTVESATPEGLGINYGVLFEYRITKHWSVATGGIWSKKIYSAYDVEYSGYNADWVDGDCRMWDIPINVYYNFSSSKPFSFYASLGLSSYIMNEENYVYYIETPYGTYDYPKQIKGENNEWFKTLNVSMGMQFRMSQQFSLQFEPTLKAPLAGVGEGEVSLVSLGAFFNLRYEIPVNKLGRNDD
jgi:hypothetical protein